VASVIANTKSAHYDAARVFDQFVKRRSAPQLVDLIQSAAGLISNEAIDWSTPPLVGGITSSSDSRSRAPRECPRPGPA
jgi:hypothetical protein